MGTGWNGEALRGGMSLGWQRTIGLVKARGVSGEGKEVFVKSAKLSLRKDEVVGAIGKLQYQDK